MSFVLCLYFILNTVDWVDVPLDHVPCRAFHLVDEDSYANSLKDEEQGEHTDSREKPQEESLILFTSIVLTI